ncbi:OLC1v1037712C1 [Oldenlandia corymbosa var. corymbosa]|uniref:OLC1v1037712C1 n=1 Tax=Oldenlandia corymbosa var. corymbosa TaxID=529605 RepID=A0AAV1CZ87_OLDCO|nr:OLC1v1037712C1 [Oldenlandia corymbosa var. corymbosa]
MEIEAGGDVLEDVVVMDENNRLVSPVGEQMTKELCRSLELEEEMVDASSPEMQPIEEDDTPGTFVPSTVE